MLLIFPFTMRESINYAIRARLRGERILGATSEKFWGHEYCDVNMFLPSIYEKCFESELRKMIENFGVTRFYTPHHLVYDYVKKLSLPVEFAEGNPITIMEEEYKAAAKSGLPAELVVQTGRIYGHMNEEKLAGMVECFKRAPSGDCLEIGCAWGKSVKAMSMLSTGNVYAIDTWDKEKAEQSSSHPLVTTSGIDWKLMENICKANVPEVRIGIIPSVVSVLHIDANHDYECVEKDWETYGPKLMDGGWLILDDIDWSGVAKLWSQIRDRFTDSYEKGGAMFAKNL